MTLTAEQKEHNLALIAEASKRCQFPRSPFLSRDIASVT